jgi:eukaryotic-like serine/threonine-protein kinase
VTTLEPMAERDRYRPLFKLDSGGMAEVYVAEAESMAGFKKKVAIKRILPGLLKDDRFVRMFLDEARLSLHLNHANIVSVFDIGKSQSSYFIVMEYVEGTNLKYILQYLSRKKKPVPVHLAVWVLNEILKGLDYAHNLRDPETGGKLSVVHRDISPPNILISWNGEVKLTDFGLAKASTQVESTDPGVVKGKFSYLSPEAASGQEVDSRADIFAVGIVAWEMLTGRRLFLGESDYQTVELVRKAEVPSIARINADVPDELEKIIRRALLPDTDRRYQTASEFADDLLGFLFSRSLKVSSRDLSDLLEEMRRSQPKSETAPQASQSNLILKLIDEEFLHFKSLDEDSDADPTGSQPLDSLAAPGDYDPSAPLSLSEFETSDASSSLPGVAREPTLPPAPGSSPMQMGASGSHPASPAPAPAPEKSSLTPWLLVLVLLAAGGGAYYWLVVLGNLDRLTG